MSHPSINLLLSFRIYCSYQPPFAKQQLTDFHRMAMGVQQSQLIVVPQNWKCILVIYGYLFRSLWVKLVNLPHVLSFFLWFSLPTVAHTCAFPAADTEISSAQHRLSGVASLSHWTLCFLRMKHLSRIHFLRNVSHKVYDVLERTSLLMLHPYSACLSIVSAVFRLSEIEKSLFCPSQSANYNRKQHTVPFSHKMHQLFQIH